ncbi:MAG: hypothetical protein QME21_07730 [Anaerolineales bacterium]|nr:hypothetical protein [Anaerolineales bacterium]
MKPAIFQAWLRLGLILTGLLGAFAWSPSAAHGAPNSVAGAIDGACSRSGSSAAQNVLQVSPDQKPAGCSSPIVIEAN